MLIGNDTVTFSTKYKQKVLVATFPSENSSGIKSWSYEGVIYITNWDYEKLNK